MIKVVETIEILLDDFFTDMGKAPAAIILGPKEYLELCEYCSRQERGMQDAKVGGALVTEYRGFMVFVKELPGIDLMIAHTDFHRYLVG